jgi:hypothetical protein
LKAPSFVILKLFVKVYDNKTRREIKIFAENENTKDPERNWLISGDGLVNLDLLLVIRREEYIRRE